MQCFGVWLHCLSMQGVAALSEHASIRGVAALSEHASMQKSGWGCNVVEGGGGKWMLLRFSCMSQSRRVSGQVCLPELDTDGCRSLGVHQHMCTCPMC